MFERYSELARNTILLAKKTARQLGCKEISPDHILLALLSDEDICRLFIDGDEIELRAELLSASDRSITGVEPSDIPFDRDARMVLSLAAAEADALSSDRIENRHLLIGILRTENCRAAHLLVEKGLTIQLARSSLASPSNEEAGMKCKDPQSGSLTDSDERHDEEREFLQRLAHLMRNGSDREALKLIDDFMVGASRDRVRRIKTYAPHAAAIAYSMRDFLTAKQYCEIGLANDPNSLPSLRLMAIISDTQGDRELGRKYAIQCYRLACAGNDKRSQRTVEMLKKRFPNLEQDAGTDE